MSERHRPHQQRALRILQLADPEVTVVPEVAVPQASFHIDAILRVGNASTAWGPLRELVDRREVVLEHYRRTPTLRHLFNAVAKHAERGHDWVKREKSPTGRPPLLLLLSGGRPRLLLRFFRELLPWQLDGIYRAARSTGDIVLIDTLHLEPVTGASIFRMTATPRTAATAAANCAQLLADASVPTLAKHQIMEFIMTAAHDEFLSPETKRQIRLFHEGREIGRREGLEEGLAEGREEGREEGARVALMNLAREVAPDHLEELGAVEDLGELQARLIALSSPR